MSWEAANAPKRRRLNAGTGIGNSSRNSHDGSLHHPGPSSNRSPQCRREGRGGSTETVEAALSRLSKAYNTSMECIGASQKTDQMIIQKRKASQQQQQQMLLQQQQQQQQQQLDGARPSAEEEEGKVKAMQRRVANAARTTLETSILMDPLILSHVPTLHQTMVELSERIGDENKDKAGGSLFVDDSDPRRLPWVSRLHQQRRVPPTINSAAHKATLRELAYLSLVNYSDLLQSCGPSPTLKKADSNSTATTTVTSLLDRGIVPKLESVPLHGCWSPDEYALETQRLVVSALCDASALDGSDPVLWLKLACASRRLEIMIAAANLDEHGRGMTTVLRSKHRRLQRYALEQGVTALPSHMPPNRTVVRALDEFHNEAEPEEYISAIPLSAEEQRTKNSRTLELTRYSWSVLGRMIIRACRGDEMVAAAAGAWGSQRNLFGSPTMIVQISPMLVLPSRVLGRICLYLDNRSIWRFEATCRALSVSIIAARAVTAQSLEQQHRRASMTGQSTANDQPKLQQQQKPSEHAQGMPESSAMNINETNEAKESEKEELVHDSTRGDHTQEEEKTEGGSDVPGRTNVPPLSRQTSRSEGHRVSKRVRSQEMKSGKKESRVANRNSFDYGFTAATLSCTTEQHNAAVKLVQANPEFKRLFDGLHLWEPSPDQGAPVLLRKNITLGERHNATSLEARERLSEASLPTFITRWSSRNSGPMDLLDKFLAHVALNVEEIFSTEPGGQMGLASCLVQCFEILQMRTGSYQTISRNFFQPLDKTGFLSRTLELFAMDLLYAELLLRQCERDTPAIVEYDDDANAVSILIPQLVDATVSLKNSMEADGQDPTQGKILAKAVPLLTRCYWLVAGFFFWRSKIAPALYVANDAEEEGLWFVQKTIDSFDSPLLKSTKRILTPHLASTGRQDACWSEICPSSLLKFRDDIQASSVISEAKQQFEELILKIVKSNDPMEQSTEVSADDAVAFAKIGLTLYERYDSAYGDPDSKLSELVEDVLAVHGRFLLTGSKDERDRGNKYEIVSVDRPRLEDFTGKEYPSIMGMLVSCLTMNPSNMLLVAQLITRVLLTTIDQYRALLQQMAGSRSSQKRVDEYSSDGASCDSDDDSVTSDDSFSPSRRKDDEKRIRKCIWFTLVLTDRLCTLLDSHVEAQEREQLILSKEFCMMIDGTLDVANKWFRPTHSHATLGHDDADRRLFLSVARLTKLVHLQNCDNGTTDSIFFHGMTRIIVRQQALLQSLVRSQVDRASRSARQRLCIQRAQFLDPVASQVGLLLSRNLCRVEGFVLKRGSLFEAPSMKSHSETSSPHARVLSDDELSVFVYSVRWLWKYASQVENESADPLDVANVTSSFDRPIVKTLRIPVATMIVGLCGSACRSRKPGGDGVHESQKDDPLSLVEFFDSDASCNDWQSDGETEDEVFQADRQKKELLRIICHAINCIRLVSEPVSDKDAITLALDLNSDPILGPRFPLVASRVLNLFADTLLTAFGGDSTDRKRNSLWSEHHPFQCQDIGDLLDTVLHMHYRWLYGFVLIGEKNHLLSAGKELAHSTNSIAEIEGKRFKLESTVAAAQLYRCIVRAYSGGRRTPPKAALELVKSALPPLKESQTSIEIRRYVFAGDDSYFALGDIVRLVQKQESWEAPFAPIRDIVCVSENYSIANSSSFEESEAMQVRRGLSRQLADGPIPVDPSDLSSDDARLNTTRHEEEIMKKFNYILDDLCISDATDSEGWYRASQCLTAKSDVIADRLGLNKGFARVSNFSVPELRSSRMRGINIDQLEEEQMTEETQVVSIEYLGRDLSIYANHAWSSFASLKDCSSKLLEGGLRHDRTYPILTEIDLKFEEKHYVDWQEAWGGMFVAALRKLSLRFLCVALYILQSKSDQSFSDAIRMAEMCESIGVAVYSQLMASQNYGYPMRTITTKRKRDLAVAAKSCFQASVEYVDTSTLKDDASDDRATWDLLFMIGKCHEKIASSFSREVYKEAIEGISTESRRFEHHMAAALKAYSNALAQAKRIEDDGGQIVDQAGGSAHGSTEVLYRLHTVRLKILIEAVSQNEADLGLAEAEALRLTEAYWFRQPNQGSDGSRERIVRDRVWEVLADIVAGFVECRKVQSYFHRSVFRHAQALMWSPVLNDPVSSKGSLDTVPATRSVQIRGLNNSTCAAMSAEAIMKSLFDKKRSQLCAVWITTTSASSPFQLLNSTIRKYDSVRGKYIAAYLDTLHLVDRRSELEIFMKWLYSSKRDLPAYFQASASAVGGKPAKPQTQDTLLVKDKKGMPVASQSFLLSFKRDANSYLADILTHEMTKKAALSSSESKKTAESYLKHTYACYLRLNCTPQDLKKVRAWKYGAGSVREVEAMCQAFLAMGDKAGMQDTPDFGDWSGGTRKSVIFEAALAKCRTMYPSLSGNFFSKKAMPKPRKGSNSNETPGNTNAQDSICPPSPSHHQQQEGSFTKMSFEVKVPEGLKTGDSFQTTVNVKDADPVKVKLTIPPGNHSTLRFLVNVQKKKNDQK